MDDVVLIRMVMMEGVILSKMVIIGIWIVLVLGLVSDFKIITLKNS